MPELSQQIIKVTSHPEARARLEPLLPVINLLANSDRNQATLLEYTTLCAIGQNAKKNDVILSFALDIETSIRWWQDNPSTALHDAIVYGEGARGTRRYARFMRRARRKIAFAIWRLARTNVGIEAGMSGHGIFYIRRQLEKLNREWNEDGNEVFMQQFESVSSAA
jgi:hypothetical protein